MKRIIFALALLLAATSAFGQSTTNQTLQTVPANNATFLSDLQNFLRQEDASRYGQQFYGLVVSGGTHAALAGLTQTPAALTAYTNDGHYVTESGAITYVNGRTQWVIASNAITGNLNTFTRVSGTHYLLDSTSGAKPSLPSGAIWLMEVTTAGNSVTVVTDLRSRAAYAGAFKQAELPVAGQRGHIAFVTDSGSGAMFFDNGSAWASIGISNPMTTPGDIIVGGVAGVPTRQACATAGTVLVGGTPSCSATPTVTTVTTSGQSSVSSGPYGVAAGNTGEHRFLELAANGVNYVGFKSPDSITANKVWVLPSADGTSGQSIQTDGAGTLSFGQAAAVGLPRVVGVIGATASTTTYTYTSADMIAFYSPTSKTIINVQITVGSLTNTITTASARNGRDQAGAFSVTSTVYLYYTWDGSTVATRSSAVAPPTGPTLANGETAWAFIGAYRLDGATHFANTYQRGCHVGYQARQATSLAGGVAAAFTQIDITTLVPPVAVSPTYDLQTSLTGTNGGGDTGWSGTLTLSLDGTNTFQVSSTGGGAGATSRAYNHDHPVPLVPNVLLAFYYKTANGGSGAGAAASAWVTGYKVANGGC